MFPWHLTTMLAIESNGVIALRLIKFAFGGTSAKNEAMLMVQEKLAASMEAGATLMEGGSIGNVVDRYRENVRANSIRLRAT